MESFDVQGARCQEYGYGDPCDNGVVISLNGPLAGTKDLDLEADWMYGTSGSWFGYALKTGPDVDLNADGVPDLVVSAPNGLGPRAPRDEGRVFVFFGGL